MQIVADTHIHLYPCYDIGASFAFLQSSLNAIDSKAIHLAFLTERHDCNFFSRLTSHQFEKELSGAGFSLEKHDNVLHLNSSAGNMFVFAGRQIVTRERIEILSLTAETVIPDGLAAQVVIEKILEAGALPVVPWAPGKWFFSRRSVVENLLQRYRPGELFLGDTTLRPNLYQTPLLMRKARRKGISVLAGSDPLPFAGEERLLGRYLTLFSGEFNHQQPLESIRVLLKTPDIKFQCRGKRCSIFEVLIRLFKNSRSRMNNGG
jgi:hypothetical protein